MGDTMWPTHSSLRSSSCWSSLITATVPSSFEGPQSPLKFWPVVAMAAWGISVKEESALWPAAAKASLVYFHHRTLFFRLFLPDSGSASIVPMRRLRKIQSKSEAFLVGGPKVSQQQNLRSTWSVSSPVRTAPWSLLPSLRALGEVLDVGWASGDEDRGCAGLCLG